MEKNHKTNTEIYRPKLHFTAKKGWINDPNGLIYLDGVYYMFYQYNPTEAASDNKHWGLAESTDLIHWEYSPINPVMMYNEAEDKQIANPFLTVEEQRQIADALDINNSDMELCEFNGRTIIYYSWGNQRGMEFLAEASYEGGMKTFLESWFPLQDE